MIALDDDGGDCEADAIPDDRDGGDGGGGSGGISERRGDLVAARVHARVECGGDGRVIEMPLDGGAVHGEMHAEGDADDGGERDAGRARLRVPPHERRQQCVEMLAGGLELGAEEVQRARLVQKVPDELGEAEEERSLRAVGVLPTYD